MPYTIYALRCRDNGRIYIGRTNEPIRERFKKHVYNLNHNKHKSKMMQSDYNKYGKAGFEMFEVFKTDDLEYAKRLEKIVMITLGGNRKENGYNRQDPIFAEPINKSIRERNSKEAENFLRRRILKAVNHDVSELTERTGYTKRQILKWREEPLSIKAVDLIRLEQKTGVK